MFLLMTLSRSIGRKTELYAARNRGIFFKCFLKEYLKNIFSEVIDMTHMLTLYRGDFEQIDEFKTNKSYKHCLLGQGIYLTDKKRVADSYRKKGSMVNINARIHRVNEAKNRTDALEKALPFFILDKANDSLTWRNKYKNISSVPKKLIEQYAALFWSMVEDKEIVANYIHRNIKLVTNGKTAGITASAIHLSQKYVDADTSVIDVVYAKVPKVGYVTVFEFEADYFNNNLFNVDRELDQDVLGYLYDFGVFNGLPDISSRDVFLIGKQRHSFMNLTDTLGRHAVVSKLKNALRPFGVHGLEYNGGLRLGGCGHHRAFCMWDDDYVNHHKKEVIE